MRGPIKYSNEGGSCPQWPGDPACRHSPEGQPMNRISRCFQIIHSLLKFTKASSGGEFFLLPVTSAGYWGGGHSMSKKNPRTGFLPSNKAFGFTGWVKIFKQVWGS